jgi:hypothetical protein
MTLFGLLNFVVLQWFGVRLTCSYNPRDIPGWSKVKITDEEVAAFGGRWWSRYAPPRGVPIRWIWMRWIWPLTGWWSQYRWISARSPYRISRRRP